VWRESRQAFGAALMLCLRSRLGAVRQVCAHREARMDDAIRTAGLSRGTLGRQAPHRVSRKGLCTSARTTYSWVQLCQHSAAQPHHQEAHATDDRRHCWADTCVQHKAPGSVATTGPCNAQAPYLSPGRAPRLCCCLSTPPGDVCGRRCVPLPGPLVRAASCRWLRAAPHGSRTQKHPLEQGKVQEFYAM